MSAGDGGKEKASIFFPLPVVRHALYQSLASGARICLGPKRAINETIMEEAVPVKYEDTHKRIGVK